MSLPLLKPLLLTVGATSLVFFGGVIALSVQSPSADDALSAADVMSQNTDITSVSSDLSSFKAVANPLTQPPSANPSPLAALTATQATALAQQDAPNSVLQGSPELVNYNGTVAYEVLLDSGATYIDASVGTVLNPVATNDYRAERFDDDDYEDDGYEDKHHDDDDHKEDKHRKAHDKKYYKENDRLIAMSYQQHEEDEYDD
ncbi:PepSY domain-containing protein [Psychrobacter aquimaris]|uniref:PepSY domain-containing protein n=1 Tax=Psychrobacter aquimaris TaxID=292733 RepID=UPI003FD462FC